MNPLQIIALAKDAAITVAVVFVIWFVYHSGSNAVKVADIQAVQKQLATNQATQERYRNEINDAFAEQSSQMGNLAHSIDAQRKPVIVRVAPSGRALPGDPASPADPSPQTGTVDIRPGVNAFERKYEQALAECRALKESWPK